MPGFGLGSDDSNEMYGLFWEIIFLKRESRDSRYGLKK
jgi:hypothetical protein